MTEREEKVIQSLRDCGTLIDGQPVTEEADNICKSFARDMESAVNNFGFNPKQIVDAIMSDENALTAFSRISAMWIRALSFLSKDSWMYDDRNVYSVLRCAYLEEDDLFKKWMDETSPINADQLREVNKVFQGRRGNIPLMELSVVESVLRYHRTLQQTFSKLVFLFVDKTVPEVQRLKKEEFLEAQWWRAPLI